MIVRRDSALTLVHRVKEPSLSRRNLVRILGIMMLLCMSTFSIFEDTFQTLYQVQTIMLAVDVPFLAQRALQSLPLNVRLQYARQVIYLVEVCRVGFSFICRLAHEFAIAFTWRRHCYLESVSSMARHVCHCHSLHLLGRFTW
jgi:hypothetical protein